MLSISEVGGQQKTRP